jgi:hypothetical protein
VAIKTKQELKDNEKIRYDDLVRRYNEYMSKSDKNELKDLRKECVEIFMLENVSEGFKEKALSIAFDCHRMIYYINITGAGEFLKLENSFELENPLNNLGYCDGVDDNETEYDTESK